jgi:DNA-binding PadR family transcriptional regulator
MRRAERVTSPLLDVLERLLKADLQGQDLHGWQIVKDTKRAGPTVYGVLDKLEDLRWITGYWEDLKPDENRPRRRLYRLTSDGRIEVRQLLAERRPEALQRLTEPVHESPQAKWRRGSVAPEGA